MKNIFFIATISLFISACNPKTNVWFNDIKTSIEKRAATKPDSIVVTYNEDSTARFEHYFSGGSEYKVNTFSQDLFIESDTFYLVMESLYNSDKTFELRKGWFSDHTLQFEGVLYQGLYYGPFTLYYPNGKVNSRGTRYKDEDIGIWEKWNDDGTFVGNTDYKNANKEDAIRQIKFVE
ncbi:MAG: toxin-antitoxin system YwqK family antitoxin [Cytophaga sp.]|uniref:toxin-antitoxin system YwqK family antitoxin n=1 Tax=Cytophaga sp. TaxID=29535 RepID=UPI003F81F320